MLENATLLWAAVLAASSLLLLVTLVLSGHRSRLDNRLLDLAGNVPPPPVPTDSLAGLVRTALPKMGVPLIPPDQEERTLLQTRLVHAGLYKPQAMVLFLGVKMALMIGPALLGLVAGLSGLVPVNRGVLFGALLGVLGMIGPSLWLDRRKANRQGAFRRALPDALDVLVICLEGGLSLQGAIRRVAGELRTAHPILATELNIVQRQIQMGRSPGEALAQFASRSDLEEVRSLSSVIAQAERFGASLVNSLRVHAETLRVKRLQYAEERAQKAGTKILIPTILFIFPCILFIVLAPAVIRIVDMFSRMRH